MKRDFLAVLLLILLTAVSGVISGQDEAAPLTVSIPDAPAEEEKAGNSSGAAGAAALILGIILLVMGWKLYKVFISITGFLIGIYVVHSLGRLGFVDISPTVQLIAITGAGIIGLFLAFPFQKSIIFLLGGLGGSVLVGNPVAMMFRDHEDRYIIIIAGMIGGFLLFGLLSLYFFKLVIIVSTSLIGSFCMLLGSHYLFINQGVTGNVLSWSDPSDKGFALLLIIALMGVLIQHGINKVTSDDEKGKAPEKNVPEEKPSEKSE